VSMYPQAPDTNQVSLIPRSSHMAWPQSYNGSQLYDDPNGVYCPDS
jgi:hypothetical protein